MLICSAGIGRTGVVVLVLYLLEQLEVLGSVSFKKALLTLIRSRGYILENVVRKEPIYVS